jgi:hypothetical protein
MRLGERSVLLLQFREQPHVFNSDDRLGGERADQRHLRVREEARLGTCHRNGADASALKPHRHRELAAHPDGFVDHVMTRRLL